MNQNNRKQPKLGVGNQNRRSQLRLPMLVSKNCQTNKPVQLNRNGNTYRKGA